MSTTLVIVVVIIVVAVTVAGLLVAQHRVDVFNREESLRKTREVRADIARRRAGITLPAVPERRTVRGGGEDGGGSNG